MANISVHLNLRRLQSGQMKIKGKSGELVECVVIPIDANNLVRGEKGVYLDLMGFELKERKPDRKDTHLVKQSLPKEQFEKLTDEQKKELPILGNMTVWGQPEADPVNFGFETNTAAVTQGDDSDLPF